MDTMKKLKKGTGEGGEQTKLGGDDDRTKTKTGMSERDDSEDNSKDNMKKTD